MHAARFTILCCCTAMVLAIVASGADAAPSISSTSGTFGHGQSVTISGSNFGTKSTAAPVVWDDCSSGTYPSDNSKWSGYWPNVGTTAYRLQYTTPIRSIGLPHSHITRYMAGCHGGTGADAGYNVMMWKSRTVSSFPAYTYASWYHRVDNNWVFGDDNFKNYDWSGASDPYGGTDMSHNWYLELTGFTSKTTTPYWHFNDDGSSLQNPDVNGHSWWWTPAVNPAAGAWAKVQVYLKITNQNDGFIKVWENGSLRVDYLGPTDKYPGTARSDSIGGYARPNGEPNNYRYFADCYLDYTPSRVVLANNSNIDNATIVENLIPTAWGASSITATVNLGQFTSGTAYLFVYDSTNAHNSTGYAITVSGSSLPTVSIDTTDASASEAGSNTGTFRVTRTGSTSSSLAVNYTKSGTASSGDYTPTLSGTVTIASGSSTADITITPVDDSSVEGSETVILTLSSSANYNIGTPSNATVTIADNDSAAGTPTFIQSAGTVNDAGGTSIAASFSSNTTAGDAVVVAVTWDTSGGATLGTVSDSQGHTYNVAVNQTDTGNAQAIAVLYYVGTTAAADTVTANLSGSATMRAIAIHEYSNVASASSVDVTAYNVATGTNVTSNSATTTVNGDLIFGVSRTNGGGGPTVTAGSGFTKREDRSSPSRMVTEDMVQSTSGSVAATFTYSQSWAYLCEMVALKATGAPALPTVTINATDAAASETGSDTGTFQVSRTGATTSALGVNYSISGTASSGDYTPTLSGTVTINSGSSTANITITPVDDATVEGDETVILTISSNANYTVGSPSNATVTIADNDSGGGTTTIVNFGSSAANNTYGLAGWNTPFIGRWSNYTATGPAGVIGSSTGNGHAGGVSGTSRTFATGEQIIVTWYNSGGSSLTFTPQVSFDDSNDIDVAPAGTWYSMNQLVLAAGASGTTTYTIDSNSAGAHTLVNVCRVYNGGDPLIIDKIELQSGGGGGLPTVTITATDASASEAGPDTGTFTVSRTGATTSALGVNYAISGTASSGDYTPTLSGTVTIASGSSTAAITITPVDDANYEGSETLILTISSNANYTVGSPSNATVTIADNDKPTVTVTATDAAAAEAGQDPGTFRFSRTGITTSALAVSYAISGTASSGDYTPTLSGTVTINAGSATADITITPVDDATSESSETVILTINTNANYTVGSPSNATVTITDNDSLPTITVTATDSSATETGSGTGTFTVSRTGSTGSSLVVNYTMSGTATNTTDYSTLSGSVTINSGNATATVVVTPVNDQVVEGDETAILTISANASYTVGSPSNATITIADNDTLIVNWGASSGANVFGITGWSTVNLGLYRTYSSDGPDGINGGTTSFNGWQCVSGSPSQAFSSGDKIVVTWYNGGASQVTFTPKVSFTRNGDGQSGTWYNMNQVTLAAGATGTSTYTVDAGSAGTYSLVNTCHMIDGNPSLLCDKVEWAK